MAAIVSTLINVTVSKLVPNGIDKKEAVIELHPELATMLESVVTELMGEGYVVEISSEAVK